MHIKRIKDKQKIRGCTKLQYINRAKRERRLHNFILEITNYIVKYCINNQIGNIVVGYNTGFKNRPNLGKKTNQTFTVLPYGKFKNRLEFLCSQYGINYSTQEESYTSKSSFWDKDPIPVWNPLNPQSVSFSGKRVTRGQYQTKSGNTINADVNGALNILRKSNVVSLEGLYSRGTSQVPIRIRLT